MLVNIRSATLSLGKLLALALFVPSALACSAPPDPITDPERAFVETPGGRRISFAAVKSRESAAALSIAGQPFVIAKFDGRITPAARRALTRIRLPRDGVPSLRRAALGAAARVRPIAPCRECSASRRTPPADRLSRELLPDAIASACRAGPKSR